MKKFSLFQEKAKKTKNFQKIIKNLLKILQQVDFLYLQNKKLIHTSIIVNMSIFIFEYHL